MPRQASDRMDLDMGLLMMMLFDDFSRTNASPAAYIESTFDYLNRADRPEVERIREVVEEWFQHYPDVEKVELATRFRNPEYSEHVGAWWELYVFTLYRKLGCQVEVHPKMPGSNRRPDFLVSCGDTSFYVECTAVSPADNSGKPNLKGQHWIQDCINQVLDPNFWLGLRINQYGTQQPRQTDITRPLTDWLAGLDPNADPDDLPALDIAAKDWKLTVTAYPIPPEKRTGNGRLLGILPPSGAFVMNDADVLHKALRDKGARYGDQPDKPLIVALISTTGFTEEADITDAVFGRRLSSSLRANKFS
jgi:hypothetical protein